MSLRISRLSIVLCVVVCALSCLSVSAEPAADSAGYLRDWLICGTFQTGGFSMVAPFYETMMRPNAWETSTNEWAPDRSWEVTWKPYHSPGNDIDFDTKETFANRPSMDWPPGLPPSAYAHLYLLAGQSDVLLDFHAAGPARVWLNGRDVSEINAMTSGMPVSRGFSPSKDDSPYRRPVTLENGVNRLLVKLYFPQKDYGTGLARPTNFSFRIMGVDGTPQDIPFSLNDPTLYESDLKLRDAAKAPAPGSFLSDQTEVEITSKRFRYVYYTGTTVNLSAVCRLLTAEEIQKKFGSAASVGVKESISGRLTANLFDYNGKVVARTADYVTYGPQASSTATWDFGKLPKGHYTLYSWIHVGGRLLKSIAPIMICVVDKPHALPRGVESKFAHSYYYLGVAEPEFVEVLAAAGCRINVGSMHWWWLSEDPVEWIKKPAKQRKWANTPSKAVFDEARKWGVQLTGDLGGCYPAGFRKAHYPDYVIPEETKDTLVVINPYWPTYTNTSPEFAHLVDEYVGSTVKKYKSEFHYWKLQNELNSWITLGGTPEWWGPVLKDIYTSAKKADPNCQIINASMSGTGLSFLEPLFKNGYDKYFDILDYHVYSWPFYDPVDNMGGLTDIINLMDKYGVKKPLWNGEFGAYRSLLEDGARAQAGAYARYMIVAHTYDQLKLVAAHLHDGLGWTGGSSNGQYPAYEAYRVCADNLEGAVNHQKLSLGDQIAAYRFNQNGGRVTSVWSRDGKARVVAVPVRKAKVLVISILGQEETVKAEGGKINIKCTGEPVYIRD